MRIAISQPEMHWGIDDNLAEVQSALADGSRYGAELVVFPELTLTGFHTRVPKLLEPAALERALHRVGECCQRTGVAAALGAPVWFGGERPQNGFLVFDANGQELLRSPKMRLMPPGEPMVFEAGTARPILDRGESSIAVVICREILDRRELREELRGQARFILWPGSMARPPREANNPDQYTADALSLAEEQDAWILHSNWAVNVEAPRLRNTGKSLVISPEGKLVLEAPPRAAGMLLAWERSLQQAWVPKSASTE